jgi:hypothetical protein
MFEDDCCRQLQEDSQGSLALQLLTRWSHKTRREMHAKLYTACKQQQSEGKDASKVLNRIIQLSGVNSAERFGWAAATRTG